MLLYSFINKNLIKRPHRLMPLVAFIGILLYFLYNPHSAFYTFALADPDDYMRLNETINWLQWAGWYDLSHPRLSPGAHTVIHWSRLLDMPLAAMMWPFIKDWGYRSSAMIAACIEPLILLGFLLALIPAMARPLVGRGRAKLAVLFVPFASMLFFNFTPGRVDHHNWEILIAGVGLMALPCMLLCRGGWKAGIFSALGFAIGLWISPETMPPLILALACLAVFSSWRGGFALRNAAVFGIALAVMTAALLPAALPVSEWHDRTVSWFSTGYVIFAGLAGAPLVASWLLGKQTDNKILRLALVMALGAFAATVFLYLVPGALSGPFADYDDFNSTVALDNIGEAQPLIRVLRIDPSNSLTYIRAAACFFRNIFPPLVALIAWGWIMIAQKKSRRARMLWSIYGICIGATLLMAIFLQSRILWFTQIFQFAPLTYVVWRWWDHMRWTARQRRIAALVSFLMLGPIAVSGAAYAAGLYLGTGEAGASCPLKAAAEYIAGPWGYVDRPYVILAGANEGPELLFRTRHSVIGANFDVPANRDILTFFNARDDATALGILRKWHVDLVLTCRYVPPFYAGTDHPQIGKNAFLKKGSDGRLHIVSSPTRPSLIEKLINGAPPAWLKPVEIPATKDYLLYEVHLPKSDIKKPVTTK